MNQIVAPKKKSLAAAESVLGEQMGKLQEKQAELEIITNKLNALNDDLDNKQKEKKVVTAWR